jgi:hypothetical protein
MVDMIAFSNNYKKFPKADCGYCDNPSCITALRRYSVGEMPLSRCIYFKSGSFIEEDFPSSPPNAARWNLKPGINLLMPCFVDPKRMAMDINLADQENQKYGLFDMVTADKIFYLYIHGLGFCPSLGIARLELESRAVEGFSTGQIFVRLALDRHDVFWQLSRFVRMLWGAVN